MTAHAPPQVPGYKLERELGVGGMATVYLATQISLDRKVAIKILRVSAKDSTDPERQEKRFLREGRMLARLSHKNVCGIYDIAKVGDQAYIAMEYIEGGTLGDQLRQGMTAADAISVIVQLAGALAAAHDIGIVHRDLKPANVMMRGKMPVLTDFGIARDLSPDRTEITGDNILGTPNYMSPEQISGMPIDGRSDVYSLGCMLFELLTGRQPYKGDSPIAVCMQHLQAPIPELPEDFAELQPVIDAMMAKNPDDRPADMPAVVVALRTALMDSTMLRQALRFDTELPWSEQLRELGFSFDGPGGEQLRASLKPRAPADLADRTTGQRARRPAPTRSSKPLPTPVQPWRPGKREWLIGAATLLVLLLTGLWWGFSEEKLSPEQRAALTTLATQFDRTLQAGQLVRPSNDSALNMLRGMYAISRVHPEVTQRQQAFRSAIEAEVGTLAGGAQFGEARALLDEAGLVYSKDELQAQLARLDQAQQQARLNADIGERVDEINAILDGAEGVNDSRLTTAMQALAELTEASDSRYLALAGRIEKVLGAALQQALDEGKLSRAARLGERLQELLPDSPAARKAMAAVDQLTARLSAEQELAETRAFLQNAAMTPDTVDRVLATLGTLEAAGISEAGKALGGDLVERTAGAARRALAAGDLTQARALLGPVRMRFVADPTLREIESAVQQAEQALLAKRRASEEAQRAGRLALDVAPWGRLISVTAADGTEQAIGGDRATPLVLTLPEGRYRLTVQGPDGRTEQQAEATVARGQLSVTELRFAALDTDAYLQQAGYQ
ncbi:MAG: protein kinase [Lysobacterales bacterium]|nr:protein kinase [Xanthomonadales bacterium]